MEILGLSPSAPKPESRWKSIFWPAIRHKVDADYIGRQGFWICLVVALFNLAVSAVQGLDLFRLFESSFFFLGGIGVRQHSRFLANVRGTWLSAKWRSETTAPPPLPLGETMMDKLTDRLPIYLWPTARWVFYVLAVLWNVELLLAHFAEYV